MTGAGWTYRGRRVPWTPRESLLRDSLEVAVPLYLARLAGLSATERAWTVEAWRARAAEVVPAQGDTLQYGGKGSKPGEVAGLFNDLAKGLAAMAHAPGGVAFAGLHWEASGGASTC